MAKTIEVKDIEAKMLDFHRLFYPEILQKYRESRTLKTIFKAVVGINDKVVFTEMDVEELAQGYQNGFTPKGNLLLKAEEYPLRYLKVDKPIVPNDLRQTYLADYLPSAQSEENEIVRKFYAAMMQRSAQDTDNALINGKYVKPTEGVAGSALSSVDGLQEVIRQFVVKKQITPMVSEEMDEANTCLVIKDMRRQIPEKYRDSPHLKCYVFTTTAENYIDSYEANYGQILDFNSQKKNYIRNTNTEIIVLPYGGASNMVLFTMENNIRLFDLNAADAMKFTIEKEKRVLNYMQDWAAGIGFMVVGEPSNVNNQYVWCNKFDYIADLSTESAS